MIKVIGREVYSHKHGTGVIVDVKLNDAKEIEKDKEYTIRVKFPDEDIDFYLFKAIEKHGIKFTNTELQKKLDDIYHSEDRSNVISMEKPIQNSSYSQVDVLSSATYSICDKNKIKELKYGYVYGTVAQDIYDRCCDSFGWDIALRRCFAKHQKLYAQNAAGEYSVWFLAHSNYTGDQTCKWKNTISYNRIEEEHEYSDCCNNDGDVRITFAKRSDGYYIFLGVYQQEFKYKNDRGHIVMVYKKISDKYPM